MLMDSSCTYVFMSQTTIIASATQSATSNLIKIDLSTTTWEDLSLDLVEIQRSAMASISSTDFAVIGISRTTPQGLYRVSVGSSASMTLIRNSVTKEIPKSVISVAQHITFPRSHKHNGGNAHAWFLPAKNPEFEGPAGSLPPLILNMHGGPVAHVCPSFSAKTQYWTTRGYAYVFVNHVGSTGYGRAYRELLDGQWGEADIADAASCVSYLVSQGLVDKDRVGITGGSAGGYATMQGLYMYPDIWAGGISLCGISSLKQFAEITHKFESHYIVGLVLGKEKWSDEARDALYRERSALYHVDRIKAPLLLLQGDADTIVPVSQATDMEKVMKKFGKDVELTVFKGEGHGWHKSETIKEDTELQTEFWARNLL